MSLWQLTQSWFWKLIQATSQDGQSARGRAKSGSLGHWVLELEHKMDQWMTSQGLQEERLDTASLFSYYSPCPTREHQEKPKNPPTPKLLSAQTFTEAIATYFCPCLVVLRHGLNFLRHSRFVWVCLQAELQIPCVVWDRKYLKWMRSNLCGASSGFGNLTFSNIPVGCRKQGNQKEKEK